MEERQESIIIITASCAQRYFVSRYWRVTLQVPPVRKFLCDNKSGPFRVLSRDAMTLRTRFLIAPVLFHFVPDPVRFWNCANYSAAGQSSATEEVVIEATQQEKVGNVYHLRGNVWFTVHNYVIRADEVTYNADTGDLDATRSPGLRRRPARRAHRGDSRYL